MNFTTVLGALLPMITPAILQEWTTVGLPAIQAVVAKLQAGKGLEEAQLAVTFLDGLAKLEIARLAAL